jgi:hypothetical protein
MLAHEFYPLAEPLADVHVFAGVNGGGLLGMYILRNRKSLPPAAWLAEICSSNSKLPGMKTGAYFLPQ